jgi:hypothetical protein
MKVLKFLVMPWVSTGYIVCADSYFASVSAAAEMKRLGLVHFIGVVKTASWMFPQDYLVRLELSNQGEREGVYFKAEGNDDPLFMAFVWVDIAAISFQQNHCSQMERHIRLRWRQVNTEDPTAVPERHELEVPQPKAAEAYYSCCARIDHHNR